MLCITFGVTLVHISADWIHLADYSNQWQALVDTVLHVTVLWNVTPSSLVGACRRFEEAYCLSLQGR
jgi:hypothetical protein